MRLHNSLINKFILPFSFSLMAFSSFSHAGGIRISPITVNIASQDRASLITLFNMSNDTSNLQVRVFKWTQSNGNDNLTETNDIIASPPFITLPPGGSFNFRVVRTSDAKVTGEQSYRVIIDELPKPQDKRSVGTGIGILIRNSLPLFVVNDSAIPKVQPSISASGLMMANNGTRHALLSDVEITNLNTQQKLRLTVNTVNGYVLENSFKNYPLSRGFYIPGDKYQVTYTVNRLPEKSTL